MMLVVSLFSVLLTVAQAQIYYSEDQISIPRFRFQEWSDATSTLRNLASTVGYDERSWELMGTNSIEEYSYYTFQDVDSLDDRDLENAVRNINVNNLSAVYAAMGFDEDTWDCWINHYSWYEWAELSEFQLNVYVEALGWNANKWETGNNPPASEDKYWRELSASEKQAAAGLCYLPETWDQESSFPQWLSDSLYLNFIEPWLITSPPTNPPTNPPTIPFECPERDPGMESDCPPELQGLVCNEGLWPGGDQFCDRECLDGVWMTRCEDVTVVPATEAPAGVGGFVACFSIETTVEREDGSMVAMKELQIGDRVRVANGKYEPIYSFGHFDTSVVKTEFVQIQTSLSEGKLEMTPNHLLFQKGNEAVMASTLKIGDKVVMSSGKEDAITALKTIQRTGIIAPFTASGTIVTNGILSSSFATIQKSQYVSLGDKLVLPLTYHESGLVFESPHRLWCNWRGLEACARSERYNEEGMSQWVETPMHLWNWLLQQHILVVGTGFSVAFGFLCMFHVLEMMLLNPSYVILSFLVVFLVVRRRCRINKLN